VRFLLILHSKYTAILSKIHFYRLLFVRFWQLGIYEHSASYLLKFSDCFSILNISFIDLALYCVLCGLSVKPIGRANSNYTCNIDVLWCRQSSHIMIHMSSTIWVIQTAWPMRVERCPLGYYWLIEWSHHRDVKTVFSFMIVYTCIYAPWPYFFCCVTILIYHATRT